MFIVLIAAFLLRLFLLPWPAFSIDMNDWIVWSNHIASVGPGHFYATTWSDYLPSYLYVLWFLNGIHNIFIMVPFEILMKLPAVLTDLGIGYLIYTIIKPYKTEKFALLVSSLYLFNPFSFFNSSIWGQVDSVFAFCLLLGVYLVIRSHFILPFVILGFSFLLKPQTIFFLPILLMLEIREKKGIKAIRGLVFFSLTVFILSWPFFPTNPIFGPLNLLIKSSSTYPYTSLFATSLWGFFGTWKPDTDLILGLTKQSWGWLLMGVGLVGAWLVGIREIWKRKEIGVYLSAALIVLAFFVLPTRVHERWLFTFFPFFLVVCGLVNNRKLWVSFGILSLIHFLNLYYVYTYYNQNFLKITPLADLIGNYFNLLSLVCVLIFGYLMYYGLKVLPKFTIKPVIARSVSDEAILAKNDEIATLPSVARNDESSKNDKSLSKTGRILFILLIVSSLFIHIFRLWDPPTYMFDEVYHAFTAVEMTRGNNAAWEWWNTPPKGFAYEWTHPPLAKEFMVVSIEALGNFLPKQPPRVDGKIDPNPFAWRFPGAILGVGVVILLYLLGRELFNWRVGLIAAFLANFDGMIFVQSRIGMNDIYFLFFVLLAFYFFLKKKWWGVGIALGLSLASKWTALYGIGILGLLYAINQFSIFNFQFSITIRNLIRQIPKIALIFIIIPFAVYLIVYVPFFATGHTWDQFIELQHQMWWYHTNLKATHPYQSLWYTWPFLYRPVWFYVNYGKNTIANIYTMGNPIIWWPGIVAILFTVWELLGSFTSNFFRRQTARLTGSKRFLKKLSELPTIPNFMSYLMILTGYFGFFLPWAFSPRIMFLYHYLPSVPFLCLGLAYGLEKIKNRKFVYVYLSLVFLVFLYFYPHLIAMSIPNWLNDSYYWFKSWK